MIIDLRKGFGKFEEYELFKFPDNSIKFILNKGAFSYYDTKDITIIISLRTNDDLIILGLVKDVLDRVCPKTPIRLSIKYLMYQQDDRLFNKYESFGLKFISNYINSLKFDEICILRPHSDKFEFIDNAITCSDINFVIGAIGDNKLKDAYWVIPDSGAFKENFKRIQAHNHKNFLICNKSRDHNTGEITLDVSVKDLNGQDCFIVDDICLGGATFIAIAEKLKQHNCGKIYLFVTHGIFNKGLEHLKPYIDQIATTDSICTLSQSDYLKIYKL